MMPEQEPRAFNGWLPPVAILLFAACLRIPGVLGHAFDQDELYTFVEARDLFGTTLAPGIDARPLYYLLQHPLLSILPYNEWGLRLLPLLFGLAGVFLTWWVARRLAGPTGGIVAGVVVSAAPWHIYVSMTARYWSLVYLLSLAFFYFFLRAAEGGADRRWHAAAVGALILGASSHPTFIFPAVGGASLVVLAAWFWQRMRWVPTPDLILRVALPFAGFLALAFGALSLAGREEAVRNFEGRGLYAVIRLVPAIIEWVTPLILAAGILTAFGSIWTVRRRTDLLWGILTVGGVGGAIFGLFLASFATDVYAYYATAMLPLLFVTIGIGVARLTSFISPSNRHLASGAITLVLLAGMAPSTASQLLDGTRFDYRPAFEEIRNSGENDLVLAWPIVVQQYYAPEFDSRELQMDTTFLGRTLVEEGRFWAIASRRRRGLIGDEDGSVRHWLSRECVEVRSFQPRRFDFRMYEVNLHQCGGEAADARLSAEGNGS